MKTAPPTEAIPIDPDVLVENHQTGVWRYLRALGCTPSQADDFTQETFLKVLEKPFQHYSSTATAAYLRKVAANLFISAQRRSKRMRTVEDIEQLDSVWQRWAGQDDSDVLVDQLRECLEKLTPRARHALELRFRDRASRSEIAGSLQITEHGAKNLMQRAKQQLRKCVESKQT